jgi:ABC-2 type transport system ATP-binding protein
MIPLIPLLDARGIAKSYGAREALASVDVLVHAGELHGLLGPNGAGKTTLLRVLFGLVRRDAGTVTMFGVQSDGEPVVPDGLGGFVETPRFYPYLTGAANLKLLARLDGARESDANAMVRTALENCGLTTRAALPVAHYSAGMRQRLGLAAALLRRPRLLLLDEPTSALDPAAARDIRSLVSRLAADGVAVLWSSHDMDEVEELCASVTILNTGHVVFSGAIAELKARVSTPVHFLRTSDDARARLVAESRGDLHVRPAPEEGALEVTADQHALDAYVLALAGQGIAVRALETHARTLESLFLQLTADTRAVPS